MEKIIKTERIKMVWEKIKTAFKAMVLFLFMIVVKFILKILTSVSDSQKK